MSVNKDKTFSIFPLLRLRLQYVCTYIEWLGLFRKIEGGFRLIKCF